MAGILAGKDLQTKLRRSEKVDFKFSASNGTAKANCHCQLETEVIQPPRICKELATKCYSYTAKEADEEREHRLPTFQYSVHRIRKERQAVSYTHLTLPTSDLV